MASEKGSLATEDTSVTATVLPKPDQTASSLFALQEPQRSKSLKRTRETTPTSPTSLVAGDQPIITGSPTKSARLGLLNRRSPVPPLTGAAALEDQRRQREEEEARADPPGSSENPSQRILSALAGDAASVMSRASDAPQAPTASMDVPPPKAPPSVSIPLINHAATDTAEASPQSATSAASIGGTLVTASPGPMEVDTTANEQATPAHHSHAPDDKNTPGSLSYPGSLHASMMSAPPARGMSFPMPSPGQDSPGQPGGKKHKCPYCETEFTRHHNLKSHLLTHSQEKPFICQQCDSRFRRLHDLKRHSKLHTGEKPHICPKCNRKFARGDALARHSKGAGGCAGRRSSMAWAATKPRNTSVSSMPISGAGSSMYSQGGTMTESPKPLSPGAAHDGTGLSRQRSPSLTQQFQQQHFGRRQSDRHTPPGFASNSAPSANGPPARASGSSHGGASTENGGNMFATDPGVWTYIQTLEAQVKQLSENVAAMQKADSAKQAQIGLLTTEMTALKKQLQAQESEAAAKQAQIGLLTAEVTEFRKQLQGRETEALTPKA
ncbi:chorion transcription factor Cf2 [Verticillium alfalfae VaMs.102]|uniref:Chorion transcription factor Cf2 n=1 Tax=Verticillium alfalfae (strain VaMs.102 / ATCC MYA-4576 / FGSC 10136) TaxID=526221 RepID=C9SHH2_VERA1|nr:chorion transcription factor Cf2 [Verticillium alfalfae VaMs.102]EEY18395.1 chorion transcription factor Cf2 [Verticillium alfalfae VaMs.102]